MPAADHGANLYAGAVLFSVDLLPPRSMNVIANDVLGRAAGGMASPALCEVAASADPDRDPAIRSNFRTLLSEVGLLYSAEDGWALLAKVGARHAREIAVRMVSRVLDPLEGALQICSCFDDYLPESERRNLCYKDQPPPLERSMCLVPFVTFSNVPDDLYYAGHNVNTWNDALPYAPANRLSPTEKADALERLRAEYVRRASACLEA
jgi:hypothetical protein